MIAKMQTLKALNTFVSVEIDEAGHENNPAHRPVSSI